MRKTLTDLAEYLKSIVLPETHELFAINSVFKEIANEENIWEGVLAYRSFLCHLYDVLSIQGDAYDNSKKIAHEYENRTTLSVYYPFLHNVKTILMNIGIRGVMTDNAQSITCNNHIFNEKLSVSKSIECLQFLTLCGIGIENIDLEDKKQNLTDIKLIKFTYSSNPDMWKGLKVMAMAEKEFGTLVNHDIFLRCDYRVLKTVETDATSILKDTVKPLPDDVQNLILQLHQRYLDKGLKCVVEIKGFWIYIKYLYKRKELYGINVSLNNGYHINVKAKNMENYNDSIETFPSFLKEIITRGYGCGRKNSKIGHCDGGCRGMIIPLNDSVLDIRDDIMIWFDKELEFV